MQKYKLITFDITGTVLKFTHPPGVHYANAGALFGVRADPEALTNSFMKQWRSMNTSKPNFGIRHGGWELWWQEIVLRTFQGAGVTCSEKVLEDIAGHLIESYSTPLCWRHCEGAIDLLERLKAQQTTLGVISNFDGRLETVLENMGVRKYFDFVLTSYKAGFSKPDPRIFEEALKRLDPTENIGAKGSSTFLHVGDTQELDCVGALKAGWNTWHVSSDGKSSQLSSDKRHFSGSLQDLKQHLFSNDNNV